MRGVWVCVHVLAWAHGACVGIYSMVGMWRSESISEGLVLSFHFYMGSRDWIQIDGLSRQVFLHIKPPIRQESKFLDVLETTDSH